MIYLWLIAFSVTLHVNSYAATYFVAKTGSNSNTCTQTRSQSTPKLTISAGIACLSSGDTLMIGAGSYSEWIAGDNIPSGSSWANTTKITGAGLASTRIVVPSNNHGINFFQAKQYIEFSDLEIDGNGTGVNGINIDTANAGNLRFTRLRIHHVRNQGVAGGGHHLEFIQVESSHAGANGTCYNPGGYCHGFYLSSTNVLVDGCSLHDNDGLGVQWYPSASSVIMRNCVVYNNPGYAGIFIGAGSSNVKIYNNTVVGNKNIGIFGGRNNTIEFRNNIAVNNGTNIDCGSAVCSGNLTSNPSFIDAANRNFRLQSGSPAIDAGMNLVSNVPADADGVLRPQGSGFDIGAYEYVGSPSNPPLNAPYDLKVTAK